MGSLGNAGHRDLLAKKGESEYLGPETEPSLGPVLVNPAGFIGIIPSEQTLPGATIFTIFYNLFSNAGRQ